MSDNFKRAQENYDAMEPDSYYEIEVTCPDCDGIGKVDCEECKNESKPFQIDCQECAGRSNITCELCKGKGEITVDSRAKRK